MSRVIRFETAADVFEAFPLLGKFMSERPEGEAPLEFLRTLAASERPYAALTFGAYLLPRREAIAWLREAFHTLPGLAGRPELALIADWSAKPGEETRLEALERAREVDPADPLQWALYAVGWSGGDIPGGDAPPSRATPGMTPQAVAAAMALGIAKVPADQVRASVDAWVGMLVRIAEAAEA